MSVRVIMLFLVTACLSTMAAGEEKAPAVAKALAGDASIPAGRLAPTHGDLTWVLTEEAASRT